MTDYHSQNKRGVAVKFASLSTDYAISPVVDKGHDRYFITPDFVGVADGATPLEPSWPSKAGEFAAFALNELARASAQVDDEIAAVWRQAISRAAAEFSVAEPKLSCTVAMARRIGNDIEVATLGDCGVIISRQDGSISNVRDDRLSQLDREVDAASGEQAQQRRLRNRASLNTPGGYWAFSANTDAADHIMTSRLHSDDLEALVLYSDGFYRLRDLYRLKQSDKELLQLVRQLSAAGAIKELRQYEQSLPRGTTRPPDDATLVICGT